MKRIARSRRLGLAAVAGLATVAIAPTFASADTFCVHNPAGCVGKAEPDLNVAVLTAEANGPGKDTIRLGAGSFADGPVFANVGNPVDIVGTSADDTTLMGKGKNIIVLRLLDPASSVSDLGVKITGTGNEQGIELAGKATHVKVTNSGGQAGSLGIALTGAFPALDASSVSLSYGPNDVANYAVSTGATNALVSRSDLSAKGGVIVGSGHVFVMSSRIWAQQGVTAANSGHANVSDSSVRVPGPMPSNYSSSALSASGVGSNTIDADRVTAYGGGKGDSGIYAGPSPQQGNTATINLRGSVLDGFKTAVRAYQSGGATSTVTTAWSAYKLSSVWTDPGVGYTSAASNLDLAGADAGFVDALGGDLHLRHDSPLIDRGDPAFQPVFGDRDDQPRARDGDGTGGPRVDIGALEYQRSAPVASASATPAAVDTGQAVTFAGQAHDADAGEAATYEWAFDDGASATGPTAQHAFASAGTHTATLTVTDPTGLTDTAQASVTVKTPAPPAGGDTNTPAAAASSGVRPSLTGLHVAPTPFRSRATRPSAAARRAPVGTAITYTLSHPATVTLTVVRASAGRRIAGACRRPTRANRAHRTCTRWVVVGALKRAAAAGLNRVRFSGRLGGRALPTGRYRVIARAVDSNGMRSDALAAGFRIVR